MTPSVPYCQVAPPQLLKANRFLKAFSAARNIIKRENKSSQKQSLRFPAFGLHLSYVPSASIDVYDHVTSTTKVTRIQEHPDITLLQQCLRIKWAGPGTAPCQRKRHVASLFVPFVLESKYNSKHGIATWQLPYMVLFLLFDPLQVSWFNLFTTSWSEFLLYSGIITRLTVLFLQETTHNSNIVTDL